MKLDIPDRQRWLVIATGVMVALYLLDSIVVTPLTATWKAHSAEIVSLRAKIADGKGLMARASQNARLLSEMEANALPKDAAQAQQDMQAAFETWGRAAGIQLDSQRSQWKRGTSDRSSLLEYRVDATGTLPALTRFIYELEHSPLGLRIDSVDFSARDESGSKLTLGLIVSGLRLSPWTKQP